MADTNETLDRIRALRDEIGPAEFDVVAELRSLRGGDTDAEKLAQARKLLKRWADYEGQDHEHFGCNSKGCLANNETPQVAESERTDKHGPTCIHTQTAEFLEQCGGE